MRLWKLCDMKIYIYAQVYVHISYMYVYIHIFYMYAHVCIYIYILTGVRVLYASLEAVLRFLPPPAVCALR